MGEDEHHHGPPSVDEKWVKVWIRGLIAVCIAFVIPDILGLYHKHGHYDWEQWPGFHAGYGFISCVVLVLAATQMRKLVMRDEEYYERD